MSTNRELAPPNRNHMVARRTASAIINKMWDIRVDDESLAAVTSLRTLRTVHPSYNQVLAMNHVSKADQFFLGALYIDHIDPEGMYPLVGVASDWHMRFRNDPVSSVTFPAITRSVGMPFMRVIQSYMVEDPESYGYSQQDITRVNGNLSKSLRHIGRSKTSTSFVIAYEGRRSEDGTLQDVPPTVDGVINRISPTAIAPVLIDFDGDHSRGLNIGRTVHLHMGSPMISDGENTTCIADVMKSMARMYPEERAYRRGVWM